MATTYDVYSDYDGRPLDQRASYRISQEAPRHAGVRVRWTGRHGAVLSGHLDQVVVEIDHIDYIDHPRELIVPGVWLQRGR